MSAWEPRSKLARGLIVAAVTACVEPSSERPPVPVVTAAVTSAAVGAEIVAPTRAPARPIPLIAIQTLDADDQAEALTKALRSAASSVEMQFVGGDLAALEVLTLKLGCADEPDAACQRRIGDHLVTDAYVWGTLRRDGPQHVRGTLHLWRRDKGTADVPLEFDGRLTDPRDETLRRVAEDALRALAR